MKFLITELSCHILKFIGFSGLQIVTLSGILIDQKSLSLKKY